MANKAIVEAEERQQFINNLMLEFRQMVVSIQDERKDLTSKLRQNNSRKTFHSNKISNHSSSTTSTSATSSSKEPSPAPTTYSTLSDLLATVTAATTTTLSSTETDPTHTISSGILSSNLTNSSQAPRPPPYKCVSELVPQVPARTRRKSSNHRTLNRLSTSMSSTNGLSRGALIVLEGLDRVGKSTLAKKLVEHLEKTRRHVTYCRFPDRTTPIGMLINEFLKSNTKTVDEHAMHLLFSANRWELSKRIRHTLNQGTTVIVDRYSYSGIAYSSAKRDLTMKWCTETERGLPRPDMVIYLELPKEVQYQRPGFGDERFETKEMQELVRDRYEQLMRMTNEEWLRVNVDHKSPDQVLAEIIMPVKRCLETCANKELGLLNFQT